MLPGPTVLRRIILGAASPTAVEQQGLAASNREPLTMIAQFSLESRPDGAETIFMIKGNITRRAALGGLAIGAVSPSAVARAVYDPELKSRSVLEWFTAAQRMAAETGDLSLDLTAAIQLAMDSGAPVIDMHDYRYRIDGTVDLPTAGIKLTGNGWSAHRGARIVNNGGKMLSAVGAHGPVVIENGTVTGKVVHRGHGYNSFAAGLWFENCRGGVTLRNMSSTGFAVGSYVKYVDGYTVIGGTYTGNVLTGISGLANNVLIDGADIYANGFAASSGQSHDLYFINGIDGIIRNCYIGDPVDNRSDSLMLRYDRSSAIGRFDELVDWQIYNNRIHAGGVRIGSDPGSSVTDRKPPKAVRIFTNLFSGGASLRFDEPQACRSWGNKGINRLVVGVASRFAGYAVGYTSDNDECAWIETNALSAKRLEARDAVVFRNTTIKNGKGAAFRAIAGYGGFAAGTIIEPRILGMGALFDAASLARYQTNKEIVVKSTKSIQQLRP